MHQNTQLLISAGFPKTGSRWLLKNLWEATQSGFGRVSDDGRVASEFILNNPNTFDPESLSSHYEERINELTQDNRVPVLHHEGISGNLFSPEPPNRQAFNQLRTTFPYARILLIVREQRSLLMSWYKHNVRLGLGVSIERYLREQSGLKKFFSFELFEFDLLVEFLTKAFGKHNVLVVPYEALRRDPETYVNAIYSFTGAIRGDFRPQETKVNVGLTSSEVAAAACLNRLFASDSPMPRSPGAIHRRLLGISRRLCALCPSSLEARLKASMRQAIDAGIKGRYKESNRKLQKMIDFDLEAYGYDL